MQNQSDRIEWRDGDVPISVRFDDPFFSLENGVAESRHVFLAGNDLPARFTPGFHIAELGFGTGLNLLVAWQAWETSDVSGPLNFTSFEAFPMAHRDMARAHRAFPGFDDKAEALRAAWTPSGGVFELGNVRVELIVGDARTSLRDWHGRVNAWFLDGFSPAKNPEMWQPELMTEVANHTVADGTFATYTAAGDVRRALSAAGFTVERVPGYGRKRHMTRGILP